jgi:Ketopantoate hydroxymethyltransferase
MVVKIFKIKSKKNISKIVCLTAYSKNIAQAIDKYTDIILVGDSLGSTLYNFKSTRSVTLEMMIKHSISVRQGISNSLLVVDMPYNTYNNPSQALKNCKKVMKLTKCDAVKIEGGLKMIKIIKHLVKIKFLSWGTLEYYLNLQKVNLSQKENLLKKKMN